MIFTVDGSTGYKPSNVVVYDSAGDEIGSATGTAITQQTRADGSIYFIANVSMDYAGNFPNAEILVRTYKLVQATPPPNVTYKPVYAYSGVQNVTITNREGDGEGVMSQLRSTAGKLIHSAIVQT